MLLGMGAMSPEFARMVREVPVLRHEERLDTAIETKRRMILSRDAFRGFFDILSRAIRNEQLRQRIAALCPWWCEHNVTWLGCKAAAQRTGTISSRGLGSCDLGVGRRPLHSG